MLSSCISTQCYHNTKYEGDWIENVGGVAFIRFLSQLDIRTELLGPSTYHRSKLFIDYVEMASFYYSCKDTMLSAHSKSLTISA